jgi:eukaryotic-like serine/threonine-protein kinase
MSGRASSHSGGTDERKTLVDGAADARYVATGHLLYMRRGTLMVQRFDPHRLELSGTPIALLDNVMQALGAYNAGDETAAGQFAVSENGTLVYLSGGVYPPRSTELVWVERDGAVTPVPGDARGYLSPRISPDGGRIAYAVRTTGRDADIWVADLDGGRRTPLISGGENVWPVWSPDSRFLVFGRRVSGGFELARIAATGTASEEPLATSDFPLAPGAWSRRSSGRSGRTALGACGSRSRIAADTTALVAPGNAVRPVAIS